MNPFQRLEEKWNRWFRLLKGNRFQHLREQWSRHGIRLGGWAKAEHLEGFKQRHKVPLPPEFEDYLRSVGGMLQGEADEHLLSFASLAELDDPQRWIGENRSRLIFADYSIFAHCYAIDLVSGQVFAYDGEEFLLLAERFHEFIDDYLADPQRVAECWKAAA